jgi:hypothetical protein
MYTVQILNVVQQLNHKSSHLNLSSSHLNLSSSHLNLSSSHLNLSSSHLNLSSSYMNRLHRPEPSPNKPIATPAITVPGPVAAKLINGPIIGACIVPTPTTIVPSYDWSVGRIAPTTYG